MQIENLAHILRAAKAITGESIFILVGSQAILVQFPDAPSSMLQSNEIDIWPKDRPDYAEIIEGAMGNGSSFHGSFGYHADGVSPETAILPAEWEGRAVTLQGHPLLEGAVAICPEVHDLAASKLAAFREKDLQWLEAGIMEGVIDPDVLHATFQTIPEHRLEEGKAHMAMNWLSKFGIGRDDVSPY